MTRALQKLNERLGLASFEMVSNDTQISSDENNPTVFTGQQSVLLPAGEVIFDINSWQEVQLPMNISCNVVTKAEGYLHDSCYSGVFTSVMQFNHGQSVTTKGKFEIHIA